jgi:hypothetical protein
MSENLHNIDDLFKKAIDEHSDMPSSAVWDAIDKQLDKKKVVSISKKYNKLKWVAAVLLLVSVGMAMYTLQTRMKNKELVKQNKLNKSKNNKENNIDKRSTLEIKPEAEKEKNNIPASDSSNGNNDATVTNKTSADESLASNPDQQSKKLSQTPDKKIKGPGITNTITKQSENVVEQNNLQNNNTSKQNKDVDNSYNNSEPFSPRVIGKVPVINTIHKWNIPGISSYDPFVNIYPPAIIINSDDLADKNEKTPAERRSRTANKKTSATTSPFSATLFYSPEFIITHVKDDHPRYREDDKHDIKNSERTKSSSSYGVLVEYGKGNKWSVQSGLSLFTRVTEIGKKTVFARPDNGGNVNYRLSCTAGSAYVPLKSGTNPSQGDSTKILSAKNTLQYVSIPLSVKYSLGNKLKVVSSFGVTANILSKGKMETVLATTGGNESSTNNIEGLKSAYLNSQLSVGAEYPLSKKISVNISPAAKFALSSINKDAAVKTKLNSFGVAAGIKIRL